MRRYNYKRKMYKKVLIIIVVAFLLICFTGYSLTKERKLTMIEKGIKDICLFITNTIYSPVKYVKEKIEIYNDKEDVYKKYKILLNEKEDIDQKNARINELQIENKKLKETLELNNSLSDYKKINATVISRDVGYWYNKIIIDKGSRDGIKEKMAVVVNGGMIGYVSEVSYGSSNVQLLTVPNLKNRLSVKIELENGNIITGLLTGYDEKSKLYKVEGISYSGEIKEGAYVTTTGLGDHLPSGILIGYVKNTTTDNFELGKILEVSPSPDFDNISYVTLLKREAKSSVHN